MPNSRFPFQEIAYWCLGVLLLSVMPEGEEVVYYVRHTDDASAILPICPYTSMLSSWEALTKPVLVLNQFTQQSLKNIFQGRHSFYQMLALFIARPNFLSQQANLILVQVRK